MKTLSSHLRTRGGATLTVLQPSIWKQRHELRDGERSIGTLTFTSILRSEALAECDEGSWTIRRTGVLKRRILLSERAAEEPFVEVPVDPLKRRHRFTVPERPRETFEVQHNFWGTRFVLTGAMNRDLVTLTTRPFALSSGTVTIGPRAGDYDELPWMVCLVWYISVVARRSKGHTP